VYLAQESEPAEIYIILYGRQEPLDEDSTNPVDDYVKQAMLILGIPYNPALRSIQARDFYTSGSAIEQIKKVILGTTAEVRHAAIVGGAWNGKSALINHLYFEAQQSD